MGKPTVRPGVQELGDGSGWENRGRSNPGSWRMMESIHATVLEAPDLLAAVVDGYRAVTETVLGPERAQQRLGTPPAGAPTRAALAWDRVRAAYLHGGNSRTSEGGTEPGLHKNATATGMHCDIREGEQEGQPVANVAILGCVKGREGKPLVALNVEKLLAHPEHAALLDDIRGWVDGKGGMVSLKPFRPGDDGGPDKGYPRHEEMGQCMDVVKIPEGCIAFVIQCFPHCVTPALRVSAHKKRRLQGNTGAFGARHTEPDLCVCGYAGLKIEAASADGLTPGLDAVQAEQTTQMLNGERQHWMQMQKHQGYDFRKRQAQVRAHYPKALREKFGVTDGKGDFHFDKAHQPPTERAFAEWIQADRDGGGELWRSFAFPEDPGEHVLDIVLGGWNNLGAVTAAHASVAVPPWPAPSAE